MVGPAFYKPEGMNELRGAYFPPARNAPAPLNVAEDAYGVFVKIEPRRIKPPQVKRPMMAKSFPDQADVDDPGLPALVETWAQEVANAAGV
jgi:hypothetical protein